MDVSHAAAGGEDGGKSGGGAGGSDGADGSAEDEHGALPGPYKLSVQIEYP